MRTGSGDRGRRDHRGVVHLLRGRRRRAGGGGRSFTALYEDVDGNSRADAPDTITLVFTHDVTLTGTPSSDSTFVLDPTGSFGVASTVAMGPVPNEVVIQLENGCSLQPNGVYGANPASSGINIVDGQTSLLDAGGQPIPMLAGPVDVEGKIAPRISSVTFVDVDTSCGVNEGDTLEISFSTSISLATPNPIQAFQLPVAGDTLGTGAQFQAGVPTDTPTVTVVLGMFPSIQPAGFFDPAVLGAGSPSGLDVGPQAGTIVDAAFPGVFAVPRAPPGVEILGDITCGPALLWATFDDTNLSGLVDPGDVVDFQFNRTVIIEGVPSADAVFVLDPPGGFGTGATVDLGPMPTVVSVVLQSGVSLEPNGVYGVDPGSTGTNILQGQTGVRGSAGFYSEPLAAPIDLGGGFSPHIRSISYLDENGNCLVDGGDSLEIIFSTNVTVQVADPTQAFILPVSGDLLGTGALFPGGPPTDVSLVTVTLGTTSHLTLLGAFDPGVTAPGSPSGMDVTSTPGAVVSAAFPAVSAMQASPPGLDVGAPTTGLLWSDVGDDQSQAEFGASVAAGDVNNDGFADVIVGAPNADSSVNSRTGKAFLYLGGSVGLDPTPAWTSVGDDDAGAKFGFCVASSGDVNGDGYDDVAIGARHADTVNQMAGKAYVYLGGPTGLAATAVWASSGDDQARAEFGLRVAIAGDANFDGHDDVLVTAWKFDTTNTDAGKAYLYLGSPAGPSLVPAWTTTGDDQADAFLGPIDYAGDVNNDSYDDAIVGAHGFDSPNMDVGKAYLFLGGPGGLSATPAWSSTGDDQQGALFGGSLGSAGDVNDDGFDDVVIGATWFDTTTNEVGRAYLFLGGSGGLSATPSWSSSGDEQTQAYFCSSVGAAGDVNGDGYGDVLISATGFDGSDMDTGKVYLFLGAPAGLQSNPGWYTLGEDKVISYLGRDVDGAGDINGDGIREIIIGADRYNTPLSSAAGKAYVYCLAW